MNRSIPGGNTATISVDIDEEQLCQANEVTDTDSDRETVELALQTLIGFRRQSATVKRIMSQHFEPDQINAPTMTPNQEALDRLIGTR